MPISQINSNSLQSGQTLSVNGITFPATQVSSANANTLDDYEEGTWTPAFSFAGGGSVTYSEQSGSYTKVGRIVTCIASFFIGTTSSPSGTVAITGLPFTNRAGEGFVAGISVALSRNFNSAFVINGYAVQNNVVIQLSKNTSAQDFLAVAGADLKSVTGLYVAVTYQSV
jgi:hypothetical protein